MVALSLWTVTVLLAGAACLGALADRWYVIMRKRAEMTELNRIVQRVQRDIDAELAEVRASNVVPFRRIERGPFAR